MAKVVVTQAVLDADATLDGLAVKAASRGGSVNYNPSTDTITYGIADKNISVDIAKYVVSKGGDVEEYPMWIKINSPEDNVPAGLIGETYEDEEGNTVNNTWGTWLKPNNYIIEREGQKYVGTSAHTGKPLTMAQLVPVFSDLVDSIPDAPSEE